MISSSPLCLSMHGECLSGNIISPVGKLAVDLPGFSCEWRVLRSRCWKPSLRPAEWTARVVPNKRRATGIPISCTITLQMGFVKDSRPVVKGCSVYQNFRQPRGFAKHRPELDVRIVMLESSAPSRPAPRDGVIRKQIIGSASFLRRGEVIS